MSNPAERSPHTPVSSPNLGTHATSLNTGIVPYDDVILGFSPHETGGSIAHRVSLVVVDVPKEGHEKLLLEVNCLRETLGKTMSALDATQARLQTSKLALTRIEDQKDIYVRIQQTMEGAIVAAQAPPSSPGPDPNTA